MSTKADIIKSIQDPTPPQDPKPVVKIKRKSEKQVWGEVMDIITSNLDDVDKLAELTEKAKQGSVKEGDLDKIARQMGKDAPKIEVEIGKEKGSVTIPPVIENPSSVAKEETTHVSGGDNPDFSTEPDPTDDRAFKHIPEIMNRHPAESIHNAFWKRAGIEHQRAFFKFAETGIASVLRNPNN